MRSRWGWVLLGAVALCGAALAGPDAAETETAEAPKGGNPPLHGPEMERCVLDATEAFMHEDAGAARRALDRLASVSRELKYEDEVRYGSAIVNYDAAYRATVSRAREDLGAGRIEDAFNQFVWVQRTCRVCHGLAREKSLLAPRPVIVP